MPPERPGTGGTHWARALAALPNRKFAAAAQVRQALSLPDTPHDRAAHVAFVYGYYSRLARLAARKPRDRLLDTIVVDGAKTLRRVQESGRGAVLVSAHLGEFDLAGSWLAERAALPTVVVTDPLAEAVRQHAFDRVRTAAGMIVRGRHETTLRALAQDLARGRLVLFMLDRRCPGIACDVDMLGHRAVMPIAPVALARRANVPLLTGLTTNVAPGQRLLRIREIERDQPADTLARACEAIGREIEGAPHQWHLPADRAQLPFPRLGTPPAAAHPPQEPKQPGEVAHAA